MKGCLTNLTSTAGQTPDIWDKSKTVSSSIIMAKELQSNLLITALVNLSFMTRGVSDNIFGPTLLDFTSIYSTKVSIISFVVIFRFGGSILGSSIAGIVLDKCLKFRYFILFVYTFIIGLTNVLLPHLPDSCLAVELSAPAPPGKPEVGGAHCDIDRKARSAAGRKCPIVTAPYPAEQPPPRRQWSLSPRGKWRHAARDRRWRSS